MCFSIYFLGCTPPEDLHYLDRESRGDELTADEYEPAKRSRSRSRGGNSGSRRSSGGGSSLPLTVDEISRLEELEVEDYLDSVAYIYVLIGVCDASSTVSTHKSCVLNCINGESINLASRLLTCNADNSCSVSSVHGSGVFESSSTILTNHHVVEEAIDITVLAKKERQLSRRNQREIFKKSSGTFCFILNAFGFNMNRSLAEINAFVSFSKRKEK